MSVQGGATTPTGACVDVASFESLARMAEHCGHVILHRSEGAINTFYFSDRRTTYRYRLIERQLPSQAPAVPAVGQHAR